MGYAAGATDEFQGTGVFSSIKFKRELPAPDKSEDKIQMDNVKSPGEAGTAQEAKEKIVSDKNVKS